MNAWWKGRKMKNKSTLEIFLEALNPILEGIATVGLVMATVTSWGLHHSYWWAMVHGLFGWLYVLYVECM